MIHYNQNNTDQPSRFCIFCLCKSLSLVFWQIRTQLILCVLWLWIPSRLLTLTGLQCAPWRLIRGQTEDSNTTFHFPSKTSTPFATADPLTLPRMHLSSRATPGSAAANHILSWLCSFWTQTGGCEGGLREEPWLCIWDHLCAFMAANWISHPSPILMQTSGWIATLYVRGKTPGNDCQTKTASLCEVQNTSSF